MHKLTIKNFKCFQDVALDFNKLTVLVGANGYGKSSVIQALLLLRETLQLTCLDVGEDDKYICNAGWDNSLLKVSLNGIFELNLGTSSAILNYYSESSEIRISILKDNRHLDVEYKIDQTEDQLWVQKSYLDKSENFNLAIEKKEFYYLNAERIGPRITQLLHHNKYLNVGCKGEFTAEVLSYKGGRFKVDQNRVFPGTNDHNLSSQVNFWLNDILPSVRVTANSDLNTQTASIHIENPLTQNKSVLSTNIGFGISYVLPIIVSGLVAEEGAYLIVENPEAHLHPSAQSKIGAFLSMISNAGVYVIVETHSDHVLNGIQIYAAQNKSFNDKAIINFFTLDEKLKEPHVESIKILQDGQLSKWPKGFFDQAMLDYAVLSKSRKNA